MQLPPFDSVESDRLLFATNLDAAKHFRKAYLDVLTEIHMTIDVLRDKGALTEEDLARLEPARKCIVALRKMAFGEVGPALQTIRTVVLGDATTAGGMK